MLHRLSEAFEEGITDQRKIAVPTSARVASFSKKIQEGWQDAPNTFPYPNAPLDPKTGTGLSIGQSLGGVEATKAHYDQIHRMANDNTKLNMNRAKEVKQAYGIDLPNASSSKIIGPTQVFAVGNQYVYTKEDAPAVCAKYGSKVATTAQLEEAQRNGADWCYSGWVAEGSGKWPITTSSVSGCGSVGVMNWTPDWSNPPRAGINCYGPKPRPEERTEDVIQPFNGTLWDQPTEPTYISIPSGYLESSGPQPACFNGLSAEQAQKGCDRLGSQCVGFSYSKDGGGHGCYKGNHAAGINGNAAYMGYVKVPSSSNQPVDGRYIRLDYDHQECLNLAQIMVYSSEGGKNLITSSTKVTKSSGYQGDMFPNQNFVNQKGNQNGNFVHTSCYDVPWIEVDLGSTVRIYKIVVWNRTDCCQSRVVGTTLSILNQEKEKVYIANPIRSTNQSYTWMPPNGNVMVDKDPITQPEAQKVYGNNGTTSCEQYCRGVSGGPWNNELPHWWNGAKCVGHAPSIPNCSSGFTHSGSTYCLCERTGTGWDGRGWRGPP